MNSLLTMSCATLVIGSIAIAGPCGTSFDAARGAPLGTVINAETTGSIRSVAEDGGSFVLALEDGSTITITVKDDTVYMLDGKSSTRSDALKVGRTATVTHEKRTASKVDVTS